MPWVAARGLEQAAANELAQWLYQTRTEPMVLDADGLNGLAVLRCDWKQHAGPRVHAASRRIPADAGTTSC